MSLVRMKHRLLIVKIVFNLFPHKDAFWGLCGRRLVETLWQKEKVLIMKTFSFRHNVFNASTYTSFIEIFICLLNVFLVVCCRFSLCMLEKAKRRYVRISSRGKSIFPYLRIRFDTTNKDRHWYLNVWRSNLIAYE